MPTALPTTNLLARYTAGVGITETGLGVSTWADQTANGHDLTQTTDADRPSVAAAGDASVFFDGSESMVIPAGVSLNHQDCTIFFAYRGDNAGGNIPFLHLEHGSTDLDLWDSAGKISVVNGGNKLSAIYRGHGREVAMVAAGSSGQDIRLGRETETMAAGPATTTTGGGSVCLWDGTGIYMDAHVYEILIYDAEIDTATQNDVLDYLKETWGTIDRLGETYIFAEGDSLTAGFASSSERDHNYLSQMCRLQSAIDAQPKVYNSGTSGQKVQDVTSGIFITTELARNAAYNNRIVLLWLGTNDVTTGRTEAQVEADIDTLISNIAMADPGATIIGLTMLDRTDFSSPERAVSVLVNDHILNTAAFDETLDVASDPRLDDYADTTYFDADGIHLNDVGYGVVAELVQAKLQAIGVLAAYAPDPSLLQRINYGIGMGLGLNLD